MEITVLHPRTGKTLTTLNNISTGSCIADVKREYERKFPKYYPTRQAFKSDLKGKTLKDEVTLASIGFTKQGSLYFKDLGPQVGWTTVFLTEYSGPLMAYLIFYARPAIIYGAAASQPRSWVVKLIRGYINRRKVIFPEARGREEYLLLRVDILAAACFSFHYVKRLLETVFVHRFSNATMPIMNIFKNSTYYWGFAAMISYFINHPLYTPPTYGDAQVYGALAGFIFGELGNFSIHMAFRSLRPAGTKERRIPVPTSNPLTAMFNFVSCPNYTYEVVAWISFSVMTQSFPALLFTTCGFYQMAVWALGKHRNYKKEFKDYPRNRKSIVPFLL